MSSTLKTFGRADNRVVDFGRAANDCVCCHVNLRAGAGRQGAARPGLKGVKGGQGKDAPVESERVGVVPIGEFAPGLNQPNHRLQTLGNVSSRG